MHASAVSHSLETSGCCLLKTSKHTPGNNEALQLAPHATVPSNPTKPNCRVY